jgi:hypothetical protein
MSDHIWVPLLDGRWLAVNREVAQTLVESRVVKTDSPERSVSGYYAGMRNATRADTVGTLTIGGYLVPTYNCWSSASHDDRRK